jgi:hypothetical protein
MDQENVQTTMKKSTLFSSIALYALFVLTSASNPALAENQDRSNGISRNESTASLYPMPVTGTLHIDLGKSQSTDPEILLFDLLGNQIETGSIVRESGTVFSIDLSGKKAGYYFIRIRTAEETISRRITVAP